MPNSWLGYKSDADTTVFNPIVIPTGDFVKMLNSACICISFVGQIGYGSSMDQQELRPSHTETITRGANAHLAEGKVY